MQTQRARTPIKKVRLTITLAKLRAHDPNGSWWDTLIKSLPANYPETKPINLLHILKSNGVQHMIWALRAAQDKPKLRVAMCADMAARVLKLYEAKYPDDKRPRDCIKACRQFVHGKITLSALKKTYHDTDADGYAALYAAAVDAADYAYIAVYAAADATPAAAYVVGVAAVAGAGAGAYAAERKAQARIIRKYLK